MAFLEAARKVSLAWLAGLKDLLRFYIPAVLLFPRNSQTVGYETAEPSQFANKPTSIESCMGLHFFYQNHFYQDQNQRGCDLALHIITASLRHSMHTNWRHVVHTGVPKGGGRQSIHMDWR